MIVGWTSNAEAGVCLVHVEGIDAGTTDNTVALFAMGAAGTHNPGSDVTAAAVLWCDNSGRPLGSGEDTSESTRATVTVAVVEP